MNRIKNNWSAYLSVIAIVCSIVAICVALPGNRVAFGMDYIGVLVGVLSLLVTLLIGWQIWSIISIDKKIKSEVQATKDEIHEYFHNEKIKNNHILSIVNGLSQGRIDLIEKEYDSAFFCITNTLSEAIEVDEQNIINSCLNMLVIIAEEAKAISQDMPTLKEKKEAYIDILRMIKDDRAIDLIFYIRGFGR